MDEKITRILTMAKQRKEVTTVEATVEPAITTVDFWRGEEFVAGVFCNGPAEFDHTGLPLATITAGLAGFQADEVIVTADAFYKHFAPDVAVEDIENVDLKGEYANDPASEVGNALIIHQSRRDGTKTVIQPYVYAEGPFRVEWQEVVDLEGGENLDGRLTSAVEAGFVARDAAAAALDAIEGRPKGDYGPTDRVCAEYLTEHLKHTVICFGLREESDGT